jgi:hypothetical protein
VACDEETFTLTLIYYLFQNENYLIWTAECRHVLYVLLHRSGVKRILTVYDHLLDTKPAFQLCRLDVGIWTGLGWPRIETGGGRLWVW